MNRRTSMEENTLDFNFWPSFSDLMLTLVLILVIVVFAVIAAFSVGKEEPAEKPAADGKNVPVVVEENQMKLIKSIASAYGVEEEEVDTDSFEIPIHPGDRGDTKITIKNEPTLQRYSFSDSILFEKNKFNLNEKGQKTLQIVGNEIKKHLNNISEIQIQGHADPDKPKFSPHFNIHLAADRAIEVFIFLQRKIGIDPARHLMSATSFGEYKPVQRLDRDSTYTPDNLKMHNKTRDMKAKNRRMEILLFYRNDQTDQQTDE